MSNYTQTTFFTPKDSLPPGNPGKVIYGAAYDVEFGNIATAIASKADSGTVAPTFQNINVIGSAIPANGIYLPAANTLGFATNTTARGSINATGTWTILAPSAGAALLVNGIIAGPGNPILYGADFTGVADSTAAFTAAAANADIFVTEGSYLLSSSPALSTAIIHLDSGATISGAGAFPYGPGVSNILKQNTVANDSEVLYIFRNANHTGGTAGYVNSGLKVQSNVAASNTNYEWAFTSVMFNFATAGNNVAAYLQGNKAGNIGPTWGAVIEVLETSAVNNPTNGTVGLEVDMTVNGTDNSGNGSRVGVDLVIRKYNSGGVAAQANWGFRIQPGGSSGSQVNYGFAFFTGMTANVGFDTSHGTMLSAAYQLAQGQPIIFDGPSTQANALSYNGSGLDYVVSGTLKTRLLATGGLQVMAAQVVGPRINGWGASSNGARGGVNGSTATLAQTAAAVSQLLTDLQTHGLLGA